MSKSEKSVQIHAYVTKEDVELMDGICEALDMPRSQFVQQAVRNYLMDYSFLRRIGITAQRLYRLDKFMRSKGFYVGKDDVKWHYDPELIEGDEESSSMETA